MKVGKEVEGRMKGLRTLFMSIEEFALIKHPMEQLVAKNLQQIYICDHLNVLTGPSSSVTIGDVAVNRDELLDDCRVLSEFFTVTVECTDVFFPVPSYLHVFINLAAPRFAFLKPTDEVKISNGLEVHSVCVENMSKTIPEDFAEDQPFEYEPIEAEEESGE